MRRACVSSVVLRRRPRLPVGNTGQCGKCRRELPIILNTKDFLLRGPVASAGDITRQIRPGADRAELVAEPCRNVGGGDRVGREPHSGRQSWLWTRPQIPASKVTSWLPATE